MQNSNQIVNDEIYESSTDCIKIISLDGVVKRVNPGGKIAMELDHLEQLNGIAWPSLWPGSEQARVEHAMAEGFEGRRTQFLAFCPTAKSSPRWWDVIVTPMQTSSASVDGLLAVSRDVTELVEAREALALANKRKNEFMTVLSHELRNPLSTIGMAAQLLDSRGDDPALLAKASAMIKRQVGHMSRLAEDLLDISRIARGQVNMHVAEFDLKEAIQDAVEQLASSTSARGQDLHASVPETPVLVSGDRTRLTQVFGNLIGNASRYSPPDTPIDVSLSLEDGWAVVKVADQGQGISSELSAKLFEAYSQGQATASKESGVGLGLAIVKGLVDLHGGTVQVDSPGAGLGSTFTVRLPRDAQVSQAPSAYTRSSPR